MVVACTNGTVEVFLGNGDGTFQYGRSYSDGLSRNAPSFVAIANLDPKEYGNSADIVVATSGGDQVAVLLGQGNGTFGKAKLFTATTATGADVYSLAVADLKGDGVDDIVTGNTNDTISVLLGNNDGTFQTYNRIALPYASGNIRIATSKFLKSGNTDLIATNSIYNDVRILTGNGDGNFKVGSSYAVGLQPDSIALGDFNNDGNTDILIGSDGGSVSVLLGAGNGTFSSPTTITNVAQNVDSVAIADINGDGNADIILGGQVKPAGGGAVKGGVLVLFGNGDGVHFQNTPYSIANTFNYYPRVVSADLVSGDTKPDLIVNNRTAATISVFVNAASLGPPPTSSPTFSFSNGVLTITGTSGNDTATLSVSGDNLIAVGDTVSKTYSLASVTRVVLDMGAGNDSVNIGLGVPVASVNGGSGNDSLTAANFEPDTLNGGAGRDSLHGGGGKELLEGGKGADTIIGGAGHDTLEGDGGNDSLASNGRSDIVNGGNGNDTLVASLLGADTLTGDNGNDSLTGGEGPDLLLGGRGNDTLLAFSGVGDRNTLEGNQGADVLIGSAGQSDSLDGGPGQDTLTGDLSVTGIDTLYGGATGPDSIMAGGGDSIIGGAGDTITRAPNSA
jgi:Ca2+-binding RTX toxin-like protein